MKHDDDNRSNQLNSNNPAYWDSRGRDNPNDPNAQDCGEDDPNSPYALNPRRVDRRIIGVDAYKYPSRPASKEDEFQMEQFRVRFIDVAEKVIKPQMDAAVACLKALQFRAEAEITYVVGNCSSDRYPYAKFKFRNKQTPPDGSPILGADWRVSFVCCRSELTVKVTIARECGLDDPQRYSMSLESITPEQVHAILQSAVNDSITPFPVSWPLK
jgi:hypothetical protein